MNEKITILLVDDHAVLRDGLKAAFNLKENLEVVGEAVSGVEAIELCLRLNPDIVVMDINMPGIDGVFAAKEIKKKSPETKILLLTMYDNKKYIMDALSSGIDGYILKMSDMEEVFNAIQKISEGESYFDYKITETLAPAKNLIDADEIKRNSFLLGVTKREAEIIGFIVRGYSNAEIAEKLFISFHTVNNHRRHIMQKLNLKNAAELVRYALENGLMDEDVSI